jgi:hypothetical protein
MFIKRLQKHVTCPYSKPDESRLSHPIQSNIHTPGVRSCPFPLRCPERATCLDHLILLDFITRIIFCEQYNPWSPSLWNLPRLLILPHSYAKISSSAPYPWTPLTYRSSSVTMTDRVSHPYKTGKISVMHFKLCTVYLCNRGEDRYYIANGSRHSLHLTYRSTHSTHNYIFLFNSFLNLNCIILSAHYT